MDQAATAPATVPTSSGKTRKTRKTSGEPAKRRVIKTHGPKKERADGTVKTTILLSSGTDELLTSLAYTRNTDRSEVVRFFLEKGLHDVDLKAEAEKAQKRFLASVNRAAGSTGANGRQTGTEGASPEGKKPEFSAPTGGVASIETAVDVDVDATAVDLGYGLPAGE
jgi:hypothetical protein